MAMFELIGQSSRRPSVDWSPAFACLAAAGITAILLDGTIAMHKLSPGRALLAAVLSVVGAVGASAIAGHIAFKVLHPNVRARPWAVALRCAAVGVWLGPLSLASSRGYIWSAAAAGIVAAATAQILRRFERVIADCDGNDGAVAAGGASMFNGLSFPYRSVEMLQAVSAAALTQLGIAAASARNGDAATFFLAVAGFLAGWVVRSRSNVEEFGLSRGHRVGAFFRFALVILVNAILLTSISSRWALLQARHAESNQSKTPATDDENLHPGIILLTEVNRHRIIAPPPLRRSERDLRTGDASPVSIPFTGEYWVYRSPFSRPPASSMVRTGSPLAYNFTNVDRHPLNMLARQVFDEPIQVPCCRRIDLAVSTTDQQVAALSLELILVSTPAGEKPQMVSLGDQKLTSRMPMPVAGEPKPIQETLRFDVPSRMPIREFLEIRIVFHLEVPRGHRSANLAVSGFDFVPRGS